MTINTIKTILMLIISYFIQEIILLNVFVKKGKINRSRFFSACCIMTNPQKNLNIIWQPPFCLTSLLFQQNRPPISISFEKVEPPSMMKGMGFELSLQQHLYVPMYTQRKSGEGQIVCVRYGRLCTKILILIPLSEFNLSS